MFTGSLSRLARRSGWASNWNGWGAILPIPRPRGGVGGKGEGWPRAPRAPAQPVRAEQVAAALAPFEAGTPASMQGYPEPGPGIVRHQIPVLPSGATLTVEPGGQ